MEMKTMPEFTTVSLKEARLQTASGRQGQYLSEYIAYITNLPKGQAGRLRIGESENPLTIRRRLVVATQTLGIPLIIKRSGNDLYFWRENGGEEQPSAKRRYTRRVRRGAPGSLVPSDMLIPEPAEDRGSLPSSRPEAGEQEGAEEETTAPDQQFSASEEVNHEAVLVEESPELGQTPV
jgi:hypothetical protein